MNNASNVQKWAIKIVLISYGIVKFKTVIEIDFAMYCFLKANGMREKTVKLINELFGLLCQFIWPHIQVFQNRILLNLLNNIYSKFFNQYDLELNITTLFFNRLSNCLVENTIKSKYAVKFVKIFWTLIWYCEMRYKQVDRVKYSQYFFCYLTQHSWILTELNWYFIGRSFWYETVWLIFIRCGN